MGSHLAKGLGTPCIHTVLMQGVSEAAGAGCVGLVMRMQGLQDTGDQKFSSTCLSAHRLLEF